MEKEKLSTALLQKLNSFLTANSSIEHFCKEKLSVS